MIDVFLPEVETHPAVLGFIVLSGYCIHRNGLRRDDDDLQAFGIRRAFRILPIYLLAIGVGIACFYWARDLDPSLGISLPRTQEITAGCVAAKVSGTAAFVPSQYECSFQGNVPLVTVMAEIWLYVVYALACLLLLRGVIGERALWLGIAALWLGGLVWVSRNPGDAFWWHNASVIGFLPYWWLGAKLTDPAFARHVRRALPAVAAGWLALTVLLMADVTHSIFAVDARMLLLAAMFGVGIVALDTVMTERAKAATRVGQAGYSIYALHVPIMIVLFLEGFEWWAVGAITLAIALIVFYLYERPLWRLGRRIGSYRRERRAKTRPAAQPI
jgi:peptidoglycan/LPS O-acetylase OafA/YrhL